MHRREFLQCSAAAIAASPWLSDCAGTPSTVQRAWGEPAHDGKDPVRMSLAGGLLAPNAHNTQPWILVDRGGTFELSVDPQRLLPHTDPWYRQTHVSQGTFLETADVVASQFGLELRAEYFPQGSYGPHELKSLPVARLSFGPRTTPLDRAAQTAVYQRRSNKREYRPVTIGQAEVDALVRAGSLPGCGVSVFRDATKRATLAKLATRAMAVEMTARARVGETAKWFRFSQAELERRRDGFGLGQNGTGALQRWVAESFFLDREGADEPDGTFARGACDKAQLQAESASAFVIVTTAGPTRLEQIIAGRAYARVTLMATQLGLAMHPMSQVIEEYSAMQPLFTEFKQACGVPPSHTVQMFVRLGEAEPTPHTPRRELSALMRRVQA